MRAFIVEDSNGEQWEVEAESHREAVVSLATDASQWERIDRDEGQDVQVYALYDENQVNYDDFRVWEV